MLDLRFATVDPARSRFKLADAKTAAGVREVGMTLYLRDKLPAYVLDRRRRDLPGDPKHYFLGTATGKRRDPDRFRDRPAAHVGHVRGLDRARPEWIAAQIGHTDPEFTFSVYQQVATRRYTDEQAIWTVMRFADGPAERIKSRQITRVERDDPRGPPSLEKLRSTSSSRT